MKRKSIFTLIVMSSIAFTFSTQKIEGQLFQVGDKDLNFTIGYGTPWDDYRTMLPPIAVSLDYGFRDDIGPGIISIGGLIGATTYKNENLTPDWPYEYGEKSTTLIVALRGTYHYQIIKELDTYGGVHIGLRYESWKEYGTIPDNYIMDFDIRIRPLLNVFAGAKYYFSDTIYIMGELGYGIAFINVGLGIKL